MKESPILQVQALMTEFKTERGIVNAVNKVSFDVGRGQTLGIVGESGSGKSVTNLSILRLIEYPPGRITGGKVLFHGKDLLDATEQEMLGIRGKHISMIFEEKGSKEASNRVVADYWYSRSPNAGGVLSASIFGRNAPACHDCHGLVLQSGYSHCR